MQREPRPAYSSPARDQQARATRRAIVAAAGELFVRHGYATTTIDAVAAGAGVGRKTVFSSVGGKGALLKLVWDWALAGDDEPVPMAERPAVRAMLAERDPQRLVRMWVEMQLEVAARAAPVGAVVLAAADVDADAHELSATIRRESLTGATAFVTHLADTGGLRDDVGIDKGAGICWAVVNSLLWHLLVSVRGWPAPEYGDWLVEMLSATLLERRDRAALAPTVRTQHLPDRERYEAFVEDRPAGHLSYQRTERLVVLTRTAVEPGYDGVGVADALVRRALDDVRGEAATRVVALCPYVTWWVGRHPPYASLLFSAD
jgi:AcrR family transcriptional regulator